MSTNMKNVLARLGFISVMGDAFGFDTNVTEADWSAEFMVQNASPGSILVCHMPEIGFREWALKEIELTLQGLSDRGFEIVSFSEMLKSLKRKTTTNVIDKENMKQNT